MGQEYLIDTNILIYYLADVIPEAEIENIEEITKIEFLGWRRHTKQGFKKAKEFISFAKINEKDFDGVGELEIYNPFSAR